MGPGHRPKRLYSLGAPFPEDCEACLCVDPSPLFQQRVPARLQPTVPATRADPPLNQWTSSPTLSPHRTALRLASRAPKGFSRVFLLLDLELSQRG